MSASDSNEAALAASPDLKWSTYLNGTLGDSGSAVAYDSDGNVYVVGSTTQAGWVSGGFDTTLSGTSDAFVAKLTPAGDLSWSTYIGGDGSETGYGIAVDSDDNILVTGESGDAPAWVAGGFDTTPGGHLDAFAVKLSAQGEHLWSTYLGGAGDDSGLAIAVDSADNVVLTGSTNSTDWAAGGFDTSHNGSADAFVAKLNPDGQPLWSTYLGGEGNEFARAVALSADDEIVITGSTSSAGWVTGGFDTSLDGTTDAFVARLSASGQFAWSTYLGGTGSDAAYGVAIDHGGNPLIAGWTGSSGWMTTGFDILYNGGSSDAFLTKLSPTGQLVWSTYLGGGGSDLGLCITVDVSNNALIAGYTASGGWVTNGFDNTLDGNTDAFVAKVTPSGALKWSTYVGGGATDLARGIASDLDSVVMAGASVFANGSSTFVAKIGNPPPTVVGRKLFYNASAFDGFDPLLNPDDDLAIATDKAALLPGAVATFANYTSYSRGINGLMIDVTDLAGTPSASDFTFRIGNDNDPANWQTAPAPSTIALHVGGGAGGSSRIEIAWPDGIIKNTWLQITVKATAATGLLQDDVFYFGNAPGESGNDAANAVVNANDELAARNNPQSFLSPAAIDNALDFNRDGPVNATDQIIARMGNSTLTTALRLIDLSVEQPASEITASEDEINDDVAFGLAGPAPNRELAHARLEIADAPPPAMQVAPPVQRVAIAAVAVDLANSHYAARPKPLALDDLAAIILLDELAINE